MMNRNEIAWDGHGRWCGAGKEPRVFPMLNRKHQCGGDRECGRFICYLCKRCTPWCRGGSGAKPLICDDCWCELPEIYKS
jgi:hypothetical protein